MRPGAHISLSNSPETKLDLFFAAQRRSHPPFFLEKTPFPHDAFFLISPAFDDKVLSLARSSHRARASLCEPPTSTTTVNRATDVPIPRYIARHPADTELPRRDPGPHISTFFGGASDDTTFPRAGSDVAPPILSPSYLPSPRADHSELPSPPTDWTQKRGKGTGEPIERPPRFYSKWLQGKT